MLVLKFFRVRMRSTKNSYKELLHWGLKTSDSWRLFLKAPSAQVLKVSKKLLETYSWKIEKLSISLRKCNLLHRRKNVPALD